MIVPGLAELAPRFAGMIVDQWGVLHDGERIFPEALDVLRRLKDLGVPVVLLSNSGRRVAANRRSLRRMGLRDDLVAGIVTSGEVAWSLLRTRAADPFASLPGRCLLWSEEHDRSILEGTGIAAMDAVDDAGFILLAGIPPGQTLESLEEDLAAAAARNLPMICCNPDRVVVTTAGIVPATGSVAARYEALGGPVHYVGKPHGPVYDTCFERLAMPRRKILAVGDSLAHDIAGGAAQGLRTAMVMGGIHADSFDLDGDVETDRAALGRLGEDAPALPDWAMPRFAW